MNLRPSVGPCPGLTQQSWVSVHEACIAFLDTRADEAAALGLTTLELFVVHPEAGVVRADFCGALVMSSERISVITANRMAFVNTAYYRDKPGRPTDAVTIWLSER